VKNKNHKIMAKTLWQKKIMIVNNNKLNNHIKIQKVDTKSQIYLQSKKGDTKYGMAPVLFPKPEIS
jgi:ribosomal protein S15P/S13E